MLLRRSSYILILILLIFAGCGKVERRQVYFKDNSFTVEMARTRQQQEKGLMHRRDLASDAGMLFIFRDEGPKPFHMKNMYIPLDIIWMNKERRVVFIKKNAEPAVSGHAEKICPESGAMYVLELRAGTAERIGLKEGDSLRF